MTQVHIVVSGFVQGVGFRQYVKRHARRLGLGGFVRNLPDGTVEAVVQGEKRQIDHLLSIAQSGPFLSKVKAVTIAHEEITKQYISFEVYK